MRSISVLGLCLLFACGAGLLWSRQKSSAQDASNSVPAAESYGRQPEAAAATQNGPYSTYSDASPFRGGPQTLQPADVIRTVTDAIRGATNALRDAETEPAKAEAQAALVKLLQQYFDQDLKRRVEELAKIEARTQKLRELLERRREKRDEIIDLQIKVLSNNAEGLGFFDDPLQANPSNNDYRRWDTDPFSAATQFIPTPTSPLETPALEPPPQPIR